MRSLVAKIVAVAATLLLRVMVGGAGSVKDQSTLHVAAESASSASITSSPSRTEARMILLICDQPTTDATTDVDPNSWVDYPWAEFRDAINDTIPRSPKFIKVVKANVCGDGVLLAKRCIDKSDWGVRDDLTSAFVRLLYVSEQGWMG